MTSDQKHHIELTKKFVKESLKTAEGGHDWFHIERVLKNSLHISKHENADPYVIALAALLHDIADSKFYGGNESVGPKKARAFLFSINVDSAVIEHVVKIIENISFKGGQIKQDFF